MKDQVKVTVIATGFDRTASKIVDEIDEVVEGYRARSTRPFGKTPPPVPVRPDTPPFEFAPQGNRVRSAPRTPAQPMAAAETPSEPKPARASSLLQPLWEKQWEEYEKPSYIRLKHNQLRKYPS